MLNDIKKLTEMFIRFRDDRDWKQFHSPKNLAISLCIESSELLELFQWKNDEEIEADINSDKKIKFEEEVADVASYLFMLCNEVNIDLEKAIINKIKKNNEKYPVEKSKGSSKKYNEL